MARYSEFFKEKNESIYPQPMIIINPQNELDMKREFPLSCLTINLAKVSKTDLKNICFKLSLGKISILYLKNIDKIPLNGNKDYWESIVIIGLKGEEYPIQIETEDGYFKEFILPFDKIKLICTCSQYPDFLKDKGMLGYVFDFSNHDSDD